MDTGTSSSNPMSQGYQSEFLTYVKRTGSLLNGSVVRTTSRYGRPLGSTSLDRRTGFVEFAPAARKFPDNSPLSNDSGRKLSSPEETRETRSENAEWDKLGDEAQPSLAPPSSATVESADGGKFDFRAACFQKNDFYRKEAEMKDRDHEDAHSTTSDAASRSSDLDSERRSRRRSPAASLNGDDARIRNKPGSPSGANGTAVHIGHSLRSSPALTTASEVHHDNGVTVSTEEHHQQDSRLESAKIDYDEQLESSEKKLTTRLPMVEPLLASRPKRNIIPKNMESGLSWREENDLKKALYASLQETKRSGEDLSGTSDTGTPTSEKLDKRRDGRKYWLHAVSVDESSQDSTRSGISSETSSETKGSLLKVRAQRKFAMGSRPGSPGTTPIKNKTTPRKFFTTKKAKTEDFLTFLCLRGSHMLPPHLDFSKIDDSEDCFQTSSCPNTPRSSRPGTPAIATLGVRDITPRGGRGAPGSPRSSSPDKDISLDDNDLGVKPLPADPHSPNGSPSKKSAIPRATPSPSRPLPAKRKSSSKCEEQASAEKKFRTPEKDEIALRKKAKGRNKRKKKTSDSVMDGKVKKKKKKRKEEAKRLRRKLVLRACNTAMKANSRKLKMAETYGSGSRQVRKADSLAGEEQSGEQLESISSILEGLTKSSVSPLSSALLVDSGPPAAAAKKRGVGRPRKVPQDMSEDSASIASAERLSRQKERARAELAAKPPADVPLTRTRSPETRSSTRASSRSLSPAKSPTRRAAASAAEHAGAGVYPRISSHKDRRMSSGKKKRDKVKRALLKKSTRSDSRLKDLRAETEDVQAGDAGPSTEVAGLPDEAAVAATQAVATDGERHVEPIYRTRSLPLLSAGGAQQEQSTSTSTSTSTSKGQSTLRRLVTSMAKNVTKKVASVTPAMPTTSVTACFPEKKGRGRPPGSGKRSTPSASTVAGSDSSGTSGISVLKMSFRAPFPSAEDPGQVVEIPTYHPSSEQFQDPIPYIQSIRADAEPFGMCRIVPPDGWKPECKFPDDLKFMTQMQYIHRTWNRWGPNSLALECIRRHLQSQGIKLEQAPMVGGVELDLPALSETLQNFGGMQSVIDKNKWPKVIESLRIPKLVKLTPTVETILGRDQNLQVPNYICTQAPERCSKLYDSYCKFLLSYDTLPAEEKRRLEQQVLAERDSGKLQSDDECVAKGRIRHLSDFFRHSRNIESVWFRKEPTVEEVEELYWELVEEGKHHLAVQVAEVDTKVCGSGFPTKKDSPYSRHGWNLNIFQHNSGSVLRCLGPISGVTVPLLHVGMMFSTKCWSANDHLLPQVIYKHTGADTVWYCLPASEEAKFHAVCKKLVPNHVDDDPVWLLDDTAMISPDRLTENGVSLGRTTLSPGQFLIVFPQAFTASISCGYNLSESLHFATPDWIPLGAKAAQMLHDSRVAEQFSMDRLLFKLARYEKTPLETLEFLLPQLEPVIEREIRERKELEEAGLHASERMCLYDDDVMNSSKKRHKYDYPDQEENVCDVSKKICYLSMVLNEAEDTVYSLEHALKHVKKKRNLKVCKLLYRYTVEEINNTLANVKARLAGQDPGPLGPPVKKKAGK